MHGKCNEAIEFCVVVDMCVDPNVGVVVVRRLEEYLTLQVSRGMEGRKMVQRDGTLLVEVLGTLLGKHSAGHAPGLWTRAIVAPVCR
jgi:hypothetical protein